MRHLLLRRPTESENATGRHRTPPDANSDSEPFSCRWRPVASGGLRWRSPAAAGITSIFLLSLVTLAGARRARACGGESDGEPTLATEKHPDQPLRRFAEGHLGVLRPEYARSYLVVAYRYLSGQPLDRTEQQGALATWIERGALRICEAAVATAPASPASRPPPLDALDDWLAARRKVAPDPSPLPAPGTLLAGSADYGGSDNCLRDAFVSATRTLAAREKSYGAGSPGLRQWLARQDAVFANCAAESPVAVPPPPAGADAVARADSAYQSAAADFYARSWARAEEGFRAIAADAASPWRMTARYLVPRTLVRRAVLSGDANDAAGLAAARDDLAKILADATFAPIHEAARRYLPVVESKRDRAGLIAALTVSLGKGRGKGDTGKEFGAALANYAFLKGYDTELPPDVLAPPSDRLAHFIDVLRKRDFAAAEALYRKSKSPVWLTAALMVARPDQGPGLEPLLAAAAGVARSSPAYATVRYHRLRLLSAAASPPPAVAAELAEVRRSLRREDGPSAANLYQELAFRRAASLDELLAEGVMTPGGVTEYEFVVGGDRQPHRGLFPEAAEVVSLALPTSRLLEVARSEKTDPGLRPLLAITVYLRAGLLGDRAGAASLAPLVKARIPLLAAELDRIETATSEPARRFELLYFLAQRQNLTPLLPSWGTLTISEKKFLHVTSRHGEGWCQAPEPPAPGARPAAGFLTADEGKTARAEWVRLRGLGGLTTLLATELADLAGKLPPDDRLAEALHLAVKSGKRGCRDPGTPRALKRAFGVLHKRFPKSDWARQTKIYH